MKSLLLFLLLAASLGSARAADGPVTWHAALAGPVPAVGEVVEVVITARIAPEWIVYASDFKADIGPQPTEFSFAPHASYELVGPAVSVDPKRKRDKTWDTEYGYFEARAEFRQKIRIRQPGLVFTGRITGQLCQEKNGTCELLQAEIRL